MEIQIINSRNQILNVIKLINSYPVSCCMNNQNTTTINNIYIEFVYLLEEPIINVVNNHPFTLTDENIINNTKIHDCCEAINKLKPFLNKEYMAKVITLNNTK